MIIRDIFHERISDPIRSVTITGKSVLIRDNKLVRIIHSAPIRVIVKAENPLRNNPWVLASTNIRSAPHREVLKKKNPLRGSDFNRYMSLGNRKAHVVSSVVPLILSVSKLSGVFY